MFGRVLNTSLRIFLIISLSANLIKLLNTLKQFIGNSRRIFWVCLTILWDWRLKGYYIIAI